MRGYNNKKIILSFSPLDCELHLLSIYYSEPPRQPPCLKGKDTK